MSEENRQQQSSAESTVAGAAKTGKAIASIAKGAATGGAHGAAVEAAKSSKKWTIPIVAVILLSVLIIAMLPSVIFGSLFGDGTDTPNGISDDTVLVQNLADINSVISTILSEGLNDVLARIDSDFTASGCDGKEVNNPFGSDVVFNANAIVSQYCAYKDTDVTSISKDDMESLLAANKDNSSRSPKAMSKTGRRSSPQTGKWESKEIRASQGRKNHSAINSAPAKGMEKTDQAERRSCLAER